MPVRSDILDRDTHAGVLRVSDSPADAGSARRAVDRGVSVFGGTAQNLRREQSVSNLVPNTRHQQDQIQLQHEEPTRPEPALTYEPGGRTFESCWAHQILLGASPRQPPLHALSRAASPRAHQIVLDNLSTHTPAAFYEAFAPAGVRRVLRKPQGYYVPKHGSWLNMVEIEMAMLASQVSGPPHSGPRHADHRSGRVDCCPEPGERRGEVDVRH